MNIILLWRIGRKILPWILLLALISRRSDRLTTPQFWAEDGKVFFAQAYGAGWSIWFQPYAGYFLLVPRIIAWLWAGLPWQWTPLAYNASALAVWAYIICRIGAARLPAAFRWLAAAAMVCTIHSGEVFLNITNLQWPLALLLAVNLLEPPPRGPQETVHRCIESVIAGLTGPLVLVASAGALARAFSLHRRREGWFLLAAFFATAVLQGLAYATGDRAVTATVATAGKELIEVFPLYSAYLAGAGFFNGWSGLCLMLIGLGWSAMIALAIHRGLRPKDRWRMLAILLGAAACLAAARMRRGMWVGPLDLGNARYTYVPLVLMMWLLAWIASQGTVRAIRRISLVLFVIGLLSGLPLWRGYEETNYHWPSQVAEAESGERRSFVVPPGFQFPVPTGKDLPQTSAGDGSIQRGRHFWFVVDGRD
jgi:hypothetical protein